VDDIMTTPAPDGQLPRVLVLWETRLLTDAVADAAKDVAEVIASASNGVELEPLVRRVQPDAIVVETEELVQAVRDLNCERASSPVLQVSFAEHRLRVFRGKDGDEAAVGGAFVERLRAALAGSMSRRARVSANGESGNGRDHAVGGEREVLYLHDDLRALRARQPGNGARPVSADTARQPTISIIVPTRNEAGNVAPLVARLNRSLSDETIEVIFADDSDDDTPAAVHELAKTSRNRIRLLHRPPEERGDGLGGAVLAAMRIARAPWVCVMDGDLQHPPELIPRMLEQTAGQRADLVVASRYSHSEEAGNTLSPIRKVVSKGTGALARAMFPRRLHGVSDPMSGFFLVRRAAVPLDRLRPRGFKILLEIVVRSKGLRVTEVGFDFGERNAGESKASVQEGLTYLKQLARLRVGGMPVRLAGFTLVGATGLLVNTLFFWALAVQANLNYVLAALIATQGSTLWNFALNERFVFRKIEKRHGFGARMALFFTLNNAALLLRGPLLVVFVSPSLLGLDPVLGNLISLLTLTLIRFSIADVWIWAPGGRGTRLHSYDIHGLLSVVSEVRLPELEHFRSTEFPETPSVNVRIGMLNRKQSELVASLTRLVRHTHYDEGLGRLGFGVDLAAASGEGRADKGIARQRLR